MNGFDHLDNTPSIDTVFTWWPGIGKTATARVFLLRSLAAADQAAIADVARYINGMSSTTVRIAAEQLVAEGLAAPCRDRDGRQALRLVVHPDLLAAEVRGAIRYRRVNGPDDPEVEP